MHLLILLLIQVICSQKTTLPFPLIKQFIDLSYYNPNNCDNQRIAIVSDKPIYKSKEKITVFLYSYNKVNQIPLIYCENNRYISLSFYDSQQKQIGVFNKEFSDSEFIGNYAFLKFTYEIESQISGGVYYAKINGSVQEYDESAKFFIYDYQKKDLKIKANWNLDSIKQGDVLSGLMTLTSLSQQFSDFENVVYIYSFKGTNNVVYKEISKAKLDNENLLVKFQVPQDFKDTLFFNLSVFVDDFQTDYSKQFQEAIYDDVEIIFNIENGKLVKDVQNKIYFAAYRDSERKDTVDVKGQIIKVCGNNAMSLDDVNSEFNGMGSFDLFLNKNDISDNCKFNLIVQYNKLIQKVYEIIDLAKDNYSEVYLISPHPKVFQKTIQKFSLKSISYEGELLLIIRKHNDILYQQIINIKPFLNNENLIEIVINMSLLKGSGVFTLQIYRKQFETEKEQMELNDKFEYGYNFGGVILQEIDFYLKPDKLFNVSIQYDGDLQPGQEIEGQLSLLQCNSCLESWNYFLWIRVLDLSSLLQVNQDQISPDLITKVFLQNEIYRKSNGLKKWDQYIQNMYLFSSDNQTDENVDYLLGIQKERKFLFSPNFDFNKIYSMQDQSLKQFYQYFQNGNNGIVTMDAAMDDKMMEKAAMAPMNEDMNAEGMDGRNYKDMTQNTNTDNSVNDTQQSKHEEYENEDVNDNENDIQPIVQYLFHSIYDEMKFKFQIPQKQSSTLVILGYIFDQDGNYTWFQEKLQIKKPINIIIDNPSYVFQNEEFSLMIKIQNNTTQNQKISFTSPSQYFVDVPNNSTKNYRLKFFDTQLPFNIIAQNEENQELINQQINPKILINGIKQNVSMSQYLSKENPLMQITTQLPQDQIENTQSLKICYHNSTISLILNILEQFNKIPCGCFEQASSTTFPLVIALKILLRNKNSNEDLKKQMIENLKKGINLLLSYETSEGGYEWFGKAPGHATLSAYGLWQFIEINKLGLNLIDQDVLQRLKTFFLNSQIENGGFVITQGLDELGNPDQATSDIYISFQLAVFFDDFQNVFQKQQIYIEKIKEKIMNGEITDSYKIALVGLFLYELGYKEESQQLLNQLMERQETDGSISQGKDTITKSQGNCLVVETTALTLLLLIRFDINTYGVQLEKGISYLISQLKYGMFCSTQGTILSLLVFDAYFEKILINSEEDISISVNVNNHEIQQYDYKQNNFQIQCINLQKEIQQFLQTEANISVNLISTQTGNFLFEMNLEYYQTSPFDLDDKLVLKINRSEQGDSNLLYEIQLLNKYNKDIGMVIINLNLPSCLAIDLNTLEDLKNTNQIDHYEIRNYTSQIVFYLKGMRQEEKRNINISFVKQFQQQVCEKRVHSSKMYYDDNSTVYSID